MTANLLAGLLQGMNSSSPYAGLYESPSTDPLGMAALGLSQVTPGLYNPYKSTSRNVLTAGLSGLASALMAGIARNSADERTAKNFEQAITLQNTGLGEEATAMVRANPKLAPVYAQLQAQEQEAEKARLAAEAKAPTMKTVQVGNEKVTYQYAPGQGWVEFARGNSSSGLDKLAASQAKMAEALLKQDGIGALPAELQSKAAQSDVLANSMSQLADRIEETKATWGQLQGGQLVSALDENGLAAELSNIADRYVRSRSGAAVRDEEMSTGKRIISGDFSVGPEKIQQFLRAAARNELEFAKGLAQVGTMRKTDPVGYVDSLNKRIKELEKRPGYGSSSEMVTVQTADGKTVRMTREEALRLGAR